MDRLRGPVPSVRATRIAIWCVVVLGSLLVAGLIWQVLSLMATDEASRRDRDDLREQIGVLAGEVDAQHQAAQENRERCEQADGCTPAPVPTPPAGPRGLPGESVTGPPGPAGPPGRTVVGPRGPRGFTGLDGEDSTVPGPAGPAGRDGADSTVAGPKGDQGQTGERGPGPTDAQVAAAVEAWCTARGDCAGPVGPAGPAGPQGPPGVMRPGVYECPAGEYVRGVTVVEDGSLILACTPLVPVG